MPGMKLDWITQQFSLRDLAKNTTQSRLEP